MPNINEDIVDYVERCSAFNRCFLIIKRPSWWQNRSDKKEECFKRLTDPNIAD